MADLPDDFEQAQAMVYNAHIEVGLQPSFGPATHAYALIKQSFAIDPTGRCCVPAEPEPLYWDIRREEPRIKSGTDFWLDKAMTDVVVHGSAFANSVRPVNRMKVSVEVGELRKELEVFGDRSVVWTKGGKPQIGTAESFTEMPLGHEYAYGGVDKRVPIDPDDPMISAAAAEVDHPGLYPRNPWGKGYLVDPQPLEGLQMPNLEDPRDLLSAERLVVGDPRLWYRQPLSWYLDSAPLLTFPRYVFFFPEADAWYPGPQDERMPEVRWGLLQPGYADAMKKEAPTGMSRQEASHGMMLRNMQGGERIRLTGMHPEHALLEFAAPALPAVELVIDRGVYPLKAVPTLLKIEPDKLRLTLTCAVTMEVPRALIPGIHKHVDLLARVNGEFAVKYVAPQTVRDRIKEAEAKG